jgi:hypothetical protein
MQVYASIWKNTAKENITSVFSPSIPWKVDKKLRDGEVGE